MKKVLLLLISNIIFAQSIPQPKEFVLLPPDFNLETDKINENLNNALKPFLAIKKYGIGIISFKATDEDYVTGANFFIFNPSTKTIKYIWFTVAGENPVGDLVKTKTGYYKTLKAIGPIESKNVGEWTFESVWPTDVVEYLKISTIKIQYMDGSFKTIKYNNQMYIGYNAYEKVITVLNKDNKEETNIYSSKIFPNVAEDDETIFTEVELNAEYPGGMGAFRKTIGEHIDTSLITSQPGNVETELSFIIEKDGSTSNIKAIGKNEEFNKEAIKTIKSLRTKWSPAKINSVNVRSIYKSKFSMEFS
ncbi:energy transducer TonB [Chryseobacterium sp. MYb328]|uniref:energy transducer TonB n=1 Tax=Chryseobacterium sp. MYb328 TaxID=2745231 RepID=UPI0030B44CA5